VEEYDDIRFYTLEAIELVHTVAGIDRS